MSVSRTPAAPVLQVEEAAVVMEDDSPAEPAGGAGTLRNLSAWSINIPNIRTYDDELKREKVPVFCIDVERRDREEGETRGAVAVATSGRDPDHLSSVPVGHQTESWSVYRRYLEFYVLESRLTEFHGNVWSHEQNLVVTPAATISPCRNVCGRSASVQTADRTKELRVPRLQTGGI